MINVKIKTLFYIIQIFKIPEVIIVFSVTMIMHVSNTLVYRFLSFCCSSALIFIKIFSYPGYLSEGNFNEYFTFTSKLQEMMFKVFSNHKGQVIPYFTNNIPPTSITQRHHSITSQLLISIASKQKQYE